MQWAGDLLYHEENPNAPKTIRDVSINDIGGFPDDPHTCKIWYRLFTQFGVLVHPDEIKAIPYSYWQFFDDVDKAQDWHRLQKAARRD